MLVLSVGVLGLGLLLDGGLQCMLMMMKWASFVGRTVLNLLLTWWLRVVCVSGELTSTYFRIGLALLGLMTWRCRRLLEAVRLILN